MLSFMPIGPKLQALEGYTQTNKPSSFNSMLCMLYDCLQVPTFIPIVMLCVSVYLVVAPIIHDPRIEFLYATLFVLSGMVFYVPFIAYKLRLTFLRK